MRSSVEFHNLWLCESTLARGTAPPAGSEKASTAAIAGTANAARRM
jgi:hypothetical protein